MGLLDRLKFKRPSASLDDTEVQDASLTSENLALRESALNKCVNYVARTISKGNFTIKPSIGKALTNQEKKWWFLLNVKPNKNQLASEFWFDVVKQLLIDGEALIFFDKSQAFLAESFSRERLLSGDIYTVTRVQNQTFEKTVKQDKAIYLTSGVEALKIYSENLWNDYGKLIERAFYAQRTSNQMRFTINLSRDKIRERAQEGADNPSKNAKQDFVKRLSKRLSEDSVVAIPLQQSTDYQEFHTSGNNRSSSVEDIKKLKNQYVDEVSEILGIPTALLHGEMADNTKNYEQFLEVVIEPLVKRITDALNASIFDTKELVNGAAVKVNGLKNYNMFEVSVQADKLISSGAFNRDEVREELGFQPIPDGKGKVFLVTKNYTSQEDTDNAFSGSDSP